jgi:tetratricopeptide (TPR) repeat protein
LYYCTLKGFEGLEDVLYVGNTLDQLGDVFRAQQNFPKALEVYRKASNIFEGFGLYLRTGELLHDMGEMYEAMGNLEECLDCYHAALDAFEMLDETTIKLKSSASYLGKREDFLKQIRFNVVRWPHLGYLTRIPCPPRT